MNQYQVDLYDFCSNPIKDALKMFCDQVNGSDADVFIIMAHKAVLLFRILLAQGYIDGQVKKKIIITNLALDFDCSYLMGKKIVILDDIVISGTSIASTVNKLLSFGVLQDDIEVIAVAIDQYYFAMQFDNTKGISVFHCDYLMEDALCIELSSTISKAFSYYGIPYDMDFPVYDELLINAEQLNILHNNLLWDIIDVSNGNQKASGVTAYTLLPTQTVRSRLWGALGAELEKCTDIKIRMYIMRYPDGTLECCIVPMCLFKEISVDNLGILYELLKPSDQTALLNHNKSPIAQMRYLEFVIAHKLYLIFGEITSLGKGLMFREDIAKRLFGLNDGETVYRHLCNSYSNSASYPTIQVDHMAVNDVSIIDEYKGSFIYKKSCKDNVNWANGSAYEQGCTINRFIFEPFMWWYDEKEIKVRKQLKEKAFHYVKDYKEIERCLFRLKNGLPMSILIQVLRDRVPDLSDTEIERTISAFLDRAIDEGIIVPTIHYCADQKYICRAYRHGEDLPFGAADQYRLVYFVQLLGEKINAGGNGRSNNKFPAIGEISLEKMIVLFYQMGLKQGNIFNRFLGFDNIDIIHSFLSVHGTIQGYTNPKVSPRIYSERDSQGNRYITWLTTWLYEIGLIGEKPDNIGIDDSRRIPIKLDRVAEYLKENERSTASDTVLRNIESLAELITTWYNSMAQKNKKIEFRDNITALTSCANRFVYASAIATEIHYFSNYWNHQARYALQEKRDYQRLVSRLTDSSENRRYTSTIIEGLHSGRMKVNWRNEKKAGEVINGVKNFLNSTSANVWIQLWSDIDTNSDYKSDELKTYTNIAEGFLYFFSACLECLKSGEFWSSGIMPQSYGDYKKCYLQLANSTALLDEALFNEIERIAKLDANDLGEKGRQLDKLVQDGLFSSEECVCKIEEKVRELDPTYTVSYKSALILDINALNPNQIEEALMRFWEQLPEDGTKTTLNLIRFPEELNTSPYVKYGIFLGEKTSQPLDVQPGRNGNEIAETGEFLFRAFETLCALLNGKIYEIRGILLPHIMPGPTSLFRHNLQRNIKRNASEFYNTVIKPLEACYDDKWQMQLVLGLDRYVDRHFIDSFSEWTSIILDKCVEGAKWVSTCIVCGKDCIRLNDDCNSLMDRIAYSQLNVECGGNRGLGLLLRLSERIVCISCNHIFVEHSTEVQAMAVSAYSPNTIFALKPLSDIHQYVNNDYNLWAKDEVIVLEPCWNGDIPFEISKLISIEDMTKESASMNCMCYGCNEENQMIWVDSMHVIGPIEKGYYQIGGEIGEIQDGFSGGIYVRNDSNADRRIIGIHEGRFNREEEARMIPWSSIQVALNKVLERGIADVEGA